MTGMLASSRAGHDKDKIYVIIREDTEYVWLADGEIRQISNPKKKRKKHVQMIKYFYEKDLTERLKAGEIVSDLDIKMFIKAYRTKQIKE